MRNKFCVLVVLLVSCAMVAAAADSVLTWPNGGDDPILKFTIGRLQRVNSYSKQADYVGEAVVENLGKKAMSFASFYLYLYDKGHKRIGEGYIEINNIAPGQQAKVTVSAHATMDTIASMELQPQNVPSDEPVKGKVSVASTPPGASLKIDGQDSGYTPQVLMLVAGKHVLEVSKEGYAAASTPVDVAASSLPTAVSLELSPLMQDTLVLRDGTVVLGDVSSVTMASVLMNVKGKVRKFDRNQVARVIFVQRQTVVKKASTRAK